MHPRQVEYLPVGAGSYHWSVTDRPGSAWFVKVDDGPDFDMLRRSLETALALHRDAGLDFVLAPVPDLRGAVLRRIDERYAVSVYPLVEGTAGQFGPHDPQTRDEVAARLAELHRATPTVAAIAPRADLALPGRDRLGEALREVDRPWTGGPHAEPARLLLAANADRVHRWLADFDRLAAEVRDSPTERVVTHGEPHPGNVLRTPDGLRLIDWTTVRIAPPERDRWMLTDAFTEMIEGGSTGQVPFYRRWWELADIAAFVQQLRAPHGAGADAAAALHYLAGYLRSG
ncbi:phosphotransferase [Micromonosporaceae bacterium Da 78-11]